MILKSLKFKSMDCRMPLFDRIDEFIKFNRIYWLF